MVEDVCYVFNNYGLRRTDGGPSGFLGQNLAGAKGRRFLLGRLSSPPPLWRRACEAYLFRQPRRLHRRYGLLDATAYAYVFTARRTFRQERVDRFRHVWFHDVWTLAACCDLLRPSQQVILQSHCPELPSTESASLGFHPSDIEFSKRSEHAAFGRAQVLVLPHPGTREIYASLLRADCRVEYLLSGCQPLSPRAQVPLDLGCVHYLYIGRRNHIKGYDLILEGFKGAYASDPTVRLILVGGGEPERHPGIVDVGRSEEPALWIASCDYALNVNRMSYFDLSVMEALSIGTPLILAATGGHAYYREMPSPGITLLATPEASALTAAMRAHRTKRDANLAATEANRTLYRQHLTDACYRERLEALLDRLLSPVSAFST